MQYVAYVLLSQLCNMFFSPCSLGIIMAEVLTMDTPFNELLDYVEIQDVLDAIAGRVSLKKLLPSTWTKKTDLVRPTIPDDTEPKFAKVLFFTTYADVNDVTLLSLYMYVADAIHMG